MRRALPPLWISSPSRYAVLSPTAARVALAALALLLALTLLALLAPDPTAQDGGDASGGSDLALYAQIVEGVRAGGNYYTVAAEALRAGDYPLRPFVTFRLPTLAVVQAALPGWIVAALLYLLAAGVLVAWHARFRAALRRPVAVAIGLVLIGAGSLASWQVELAGFHEVWAGLLIALSLARFRPDRWAEAIGWGLTAAVIRETAALYLLVMAALAWRDGDRRQAFAWGAALAMLALLLAAHAYGVAQVVRPLDPASLGWAGLLGPGFAVRTAHASTGLSLLPLGLGAPLVGLALFGWTAWNSPVALRVVATLLAYAALLATAGRLDTFYWGLLVAPVLLAGLVFAPDGLRDLFAAALDRRRIVVRRVAP
jgi:hypothetical protein